VSELRSGAHADSHDRAGDRRPAARRESEPNLSTPGRTGNPRRSRVTSAQLAQLQRLAGNHAVSGLVAASAGGLSRNRATESAEMSWPIQRSGDHACADARAGHDSAREAAKANPLQLLSTQGPAVQRDFLSDAWKAASDAGPAVANASRLAAQVAANPAMLPTVMGAIAWDQIPEPLKGPIIDQVLRACLTAARTVEIPDVTGSRVATIIKHLVIGALERALTYPTGMKVRAADRIAKIVLNPSPEFSLGFLKGLVVGLWDGLTGPFVLLWDLTKIGYEIQAAQVRFLVKMADSKSREQLGKDVQAALDKIEPRIAKVVADLLAGKADPRQIMHLIDDLVNSALKGVQSLGASLSDALLKFMNRPDKELGEGVGWVAGTATFEVLLLVLTEGGYTALKEAVQGLRVVVRMVEAGSVAWEALGPVRAALAGFRKLATSNKALAPLVEAVEEALSLLVKFLRLSYGLEGGAARTGEKVAGAAERGAAREIRVADTALGETHEITLLADGRMIRCSDKCMQLAENIAQRAKGLAGEGVADSAKLVDEAERIAAEARALKADTALSDAERAVKEENLLREAESLERRTAAAEREAFDRMSSGARTQLQSCRDFAAANRDFPAMKQFDGQITQLEEDLNKSAEFLADPELRPIAKEDLINLEKQARDLEAEMRKIVPEKPVTPTTGPTFDVNEFERRISGMRVEERAPVVYAEAERQAAAHGWVRDRRVSTVNNRDIYRDPTTGHYYSVDTQHGRFEHCNARGRHIEEVKLNGEPVPNSQADNHSIEIP
jgi:hypothetical protein